MHRYLARITVGAALLLPGLCTAQAALPVPEAPTSETPCGGNAGLPGWFRPGTYRGTLGAAGITLELKRPASGDDEVGAYFYHSRQTNLTLRGAQQGSALVLAETVWSGPEQGLQTTGCLTLSTVGGGLKGTWRPPQDKGKAVAVNLQLLSVAAVPLRLLNTPGLVKLRRETPLTFLKLNAAWIKVAGGLREPISGVVYPRVSGASLPLSGALQDRQLQAAASALDCRAQLGNTPSGEGGGFTFAAQVTRLTSRLVSLRENADYYCGGAHPDNFTAGVLLDRQTGQALSWAALWPKLSGQLLSRYLEHYPKAAGRECLEAVRTGFTEAGDFTGWLTMQGLTLEPTFLPHVSAACAEPVTLSYAELRPLENVGSPYLQDLRPR